MIATHMYWFRMLFNVSISPVIITEIGIATKTDAINTVILFFAAFNAGLVSHIAGDRTIKVMNQPAPKGRGKYLTQNEFGTVLENKY